MFWSNPIGFNSLDQNSFLAAVSGYS